MRHRLLDHVHRPPFAVLAVATLLLLVLPLVGCEAGSGGEVGPDEGGAPVIEGEVQRDELDEDADYVHTMTTEHADDSPVPGFAREEGRYAGVEVVTEQVQYASADGEPVSGYLAMPEGAGRRPEPGLPGIILIHEWWGLNENMETMARLLARRGYVALAVDLYGGEVAQSPEKARELMGAIDEERAKDNLRQALGYLVREENVGRVGVIGWCFGGGWSLRTALTMPGQIDAAVIYYGRLVQDRDELKKLDMPILGIFGAEDEGIPASEVRQFESTLEELGKDARIEIYEGAGHAFANPSGERYEPEAAKDAWQKTVDFLDEHLKQ